MASRRCPARGRCGSVSSPYVVGLLDYSAGLLAAFRIASLPLPAPDAIGAPGIEPG